MLSIWLLVFFVIFAILFISNSDLQQAEDLTIRQVLQEAEKGNETRIVPGAVIKSAPHGGNKWHEIRGRIKQPGGEDVAFIAEGQLTEDNLQLLQESDLFREEPASTLFTQVILNLLPIVLILLILYFLFVRQLRSAGRGAMNFGKSKARLLKRVGHTQKAYQLLTEVYSWFTEGFDTKDLKAAKQLLDELRV